MSLTDTLAIINGPEDGTEFPLLRAPFYIGRSPSCEVPIRLDAGVADAHVLITAVPEGYRVRRLEPAPVYVDGKRAGMLRSRIARSGSTLRIGHTCLALECVPEGLAARSRGVASESDLGWLLGRLLHGGARLATHLFRMLTALCGRVFGSSLAVVGLLVLLYFLLPPVRYWTQWVFAYAQYYIADFFMKP